MGLYDDQDRQYQTTYNPPAGGMAQQRVTRTKDLGTNQSVSEFILRPSRVAFWLAATKGGGGFFCVASLFIWSINTLSGDGDQDYWLIVAAGFFFAMFYAGDHGLAWLAQRVEDYKIAARGQETEITEKQAAAAAQAQAETGIEPARVKGPLNTAVIRQTKAGAFHGMVREILSPTARLQFSDRACLRFGFDKQELIGELRRAGILHHSELINNAPSLTAEGKKALEAWLTGSPYPAP